MPSPLAGLPVSIKNLCNVAGETTLAGSKALDDAPPAKADAPVVARLRAAGAVIVGSTNMSEFAFSGVGFNPHYGTPGNPADRKRVPGGSSSGAAVSVGRPHGGGGARHRHRRLGAHSRRRVRHHRLQADGAARADRRRGAALDLARFDRPARQLGRVLRHRRCGVRRRADRRARARAAGRPALRRSHALRDGRPRSRRRQGLRAGAEGAGGQRREGRADRPAAAQRAADDQRQGRLRRVRGLCLAQGADRPPRQRTTTSWSRRASARQGDERRRLYRPAGQRAPTCRSACRRSLRTTTPSSCRPAPSPRRRSTRSRRPRASPGRTCCCCATPRSATS